MNAPPQNQPVVAVSPSEVDSGANMVAPVFVWHFEGVLKIQ